MFGHTALEIFMFFEEWLKTEEKFNGAFEFSFLNISCGKIYELASVFHYFKRLLGKGLFLETQQRLCMK